MNAANKLRIMLNFLNVPLSIPKKFIELQSFLESNPNFSDAPDVIVWVRNAIVHPKSKKREKIANSHYKVRSESLDLQLWYIELFLLKIFDYNGVYINRCSSNYSNSGKREKLPWLR